MRIDDYAYGRIVIDGREERRDVVLTRDGLHPNWWRDEGHRLAIHDLETVLAAQPALLIVGTGTAGNMRPDPELASALEERGITMEAMPTHDAVRRINELVDLGDIDWAAALHLTC